MSDIMALDLAELTAISLEPPDDLRDQDPTTGGSDFVGLDDPDIRTLAPSLQIVFQELLTLRWLGRTCNLRQLQSTLSLDLIELQSRLQRLAAHGLIEDPRSSTENLQVIPRAERVVRNSRTPVTGPGSVSNPPPPVPSLPPATTVAVDPQPPLLRNLPASDRQALQPPTAAPASRPGERERLATTPLPETLPTQAGSEPAAQPAFSSTTVPLWIEQLMASPRFEEQQKNAGRIRLNREEFARILQAINDRGGRTTVAALSHQLNISLHRLDGRLAIFQRVLNMDGSVIFRRDHASDTVEIDRNLLQRQFELL
ncbi:MAG: hypothetical protein ACKO3T_09530 [Planctomycetaceae bacterium]